MSPVLLSAPPQSVMCWPSCWSSFPCASWWYRSALACGPVCCSRSVDPCSSALRSTPCCSAGSVLLYPATGRACRQSNRRFQRCRRVNPRECRRMRARATAAHRQQAERWTQPYRQRRARNRMHPITDFLFIYYRNAPSQLEAWHPGLGVALEATRLPNGFNAKQYCFADGYARLAPEQMDAASQHRLSMALQLCRRVQERPGQFGCFGMHEWAMVYRGEADGEVRHRERLPLRLPRDQIRADRKPADCAAISTHSAFHALPSASTGCNRAKTAACTTNNAAACTPTWTCINSPRSACRGSAPTCCGKPLNLPPGAPARHAGQPV